MRFKTMKVGKPFADGKDEVNLRCWLFRCIPITLHLKKPQAMAIATVILKYYSDPNREK